MSVRLLSIDDSKMVHSIIRKTIAPYDATLLVAHSGVEGLIVARAEHPDIILLDIHMPEMNGLETLDELKRDPATADIPVILLTADAGVENQEPAFESGAFMYLTKPFTEDIFLAAIEGVLPLEKRTA